MRRIFKKTYEYFRYTLNPLRVRNEHRSAYLKGVYDCIKYLEKDAWHTITDDTDSYPECYRCVLAEDDEGDKNIACCDANCDWYISNGESTLKLIGEVVKWVEID